MIAPLAAAALLAVTLTADPEQRDAGGSGGPGPGDEPEAVTATAGPQFPKILGPGGKSPKVISPPPAPETMPEGPRPGEFPNPDVPIKPRPPKEEETFLERITPPYELWSPDFLLCPVPVVYSDPNLGFGIGIMPVFLYRPAGPMGADGRPLPPRIEVIEAPSIDYNDIQSVTFANRLFWYPTYHEEFLLFDSISLHANTEHEIHFHGRNRIVEHSDIFARGVYLIDGTRRFFGIGADTPEKNQSNYEQREASAEADVGYRLFDERVRLGATLRFRHTRISDGLIKTLPETKERFPNVPGVTDSPLDTLAFGIHGTLDLRDSDVVPTTGLLLDLLFEAAPKGVISDIHFYRWKADVVYHVPIVEDDWTHVMRATWHGVSADDHTPFWELPTLGGASNLRGFGVGRFTDDNYLLFSVEERWRALQFEVSDNKIIIEFAGFLDVGRVYGRGGGLDDSDWNFVPGAGARLLLPDSAIIARADFGYGQEGLAAFVVLGYPF